MNQKLGESLNQLIPSKKAAVCTVESCTGGLIASTITSTPGVSSWYWGGWITYNNQAKINLGVPKNLLDKSGAVSKECCKSMLLNAFKKSSCTHILATTGVAGPSGGSKEKPVGTIFIGILTPQHMKIHSYLLTGNRESIQKQTTTHALNLLIKELRND
ncbi:MAG TPA: CinA family protein [Gammaproteobacteria bacterium]|nr:CinA family protein [Gammaproteobacteria bacterium]